MNTVDRLVPGVTTVTLNARYYALHGLIATEASNQELDAASAQDLLRRAEVALGAVSARHLRVEPDAHQGLSRPHGYDVIAPRLDAGVEIGTLAARGAYAQSAWGFWPPYRGSEATLQITAANELAPGERFDIQNVQAGLGDVLHLAKRAVLDVDALDSNAHLCVCRSVTSTDGDWLARLFAQPGISDDRQTRAWTRRQTLRILTRCVQLTDVREASRDVSRFIGYNSAVNSDPVLTGTVITAQWRGLVLRNHSVGAWRELWAWVVNGIDGLTSRATLGNRFADALPDQTLGSFKDGLPPSRTADGQPAPAELDADLAEADWPERCIGILLLGARRTSELAGHELSGFQGTNPDDVFEELSPQWLADQVDTWRDRSVRDFARWLTEVMINRSQRLASRKARPDKTGVLKIPSRVYLRDGFIFRDSPETGGRPSVRLGQLAGVLAGVGLLVRDADRWVVGPRGEFLV